MNKLLVASFFLVLIAAGPKCDIVQEAFNGLFEENKLPKPVHTVSCFTEDTCVKLVKFVGEVLDKAAKGSVKDLIELKNLIEKFGDQIPESEKKCLDADPELQKLSAKYPVDDKTEKKAIAFVTTHYLEVHGWFGNLDKIWRAGKYYQTGYDGAGYAHKVIGSAQVELTSDKDDLQAGLDGLFEVNNLPDSKTIVPCFDDAFAKKLKAFATDLMKKACKAGVKDFVDLVEMIKHFEVPDAVSKCLDGNAELEALGKKYGITPDTDPDKIIKKVLTYVGLHYLEVHKNACDFNTLW